MTTKTFSIPQPIIQDANCEYFAIKYRKISPTQENWQTIPNVTTNTFDLELDYNSQYEIEAIHHCCNGIDSLPTTITFDTSLGNPLIYVCLTANTQTDTCSTTTGSCRNCEIQKMFKLRFYSDVSASTTIIPNSNTRIKLQEIINGIPQTPYYLDLNSISSYEYQLFSKITRKETCNNGVQNIETYDLVVLDGQFEQYPYKITTCSSNNPTLTQISNTDTGPGGKRTQIFRVGNDVVAGNRFELMVYSVGRTVTAVQGDTATSIAQKLVAAINNTSTSEWNQYSNHNGINGFPPHANSNGADITITLNYQNQFGGYAYEN